MFWLCRKTTRSFLCIFSQHCARMHHGLRKSMPSWDGQMVRVSLFYFFCVTFSRKKGKQKRTKNHLFLQRNKRSPEKEGVGQSVPKCLQSLIHVYCALQLERNDCGRRAWNIACKWWPTCSILWHIIRTLLLGTSSNVRLFFLNKNCTCLCFLMHL